MKKDNIQILEHKIRTGCEPDNHSLFERWFAHSQCCKKKHHSNLCLHCTQARQQQHYTNQFELLLATALDELIPSQWREACLNHIHRPLGCLERLAITDAHKQQVQTLMHELSINTHYAMTHCYQHNQQY